jgi:hypothetical protein
LQEANEESASSVHTPLKPRKDVKVLRSRLGPVLAGPPRLLKMSVSILALPSASPEKDSEIEGGEGISGHVDQKRTLVACARARYIGGEEGGSEYWWFRISPDGRRQQLGEPCPAPNHPSTEHPTTALAHFPISDSRYYLITPGNFLLQSRLSL